MVSVTAAIALLALYRYRKRKERLKRMARARSLAKSKSIRPRHDDLPDVVPQPRRLPQRAHRTAALERIAAQVAILERFEREALVSPPANEVMQLPIEFEFDVVSSDDESSTGNDDSGISTGSLSDGEGFVDTILDKRILEDGTVQYKVRWTEPDWEDSWLPGAQVGLGLIEEYEQK